MSKVKMICPCCGEEIVLEIDGESIVSINHQIKILSQITIKQLNSKNIEFGCLKEGEKNE